MSIRHSLHAADLVVVGSGLYGLTIADHATQTSPGDVHSPEPTRGADNSDHH